MKKFAFTLLAMATALAITPAAKADPVAAGSVLNVNGLIAENGTIQPGLSNVYALGYTGTFATELNSPVLLTSSPTAGTANTYTLLGSGPVGDSFTVQSSVDGSGNSVAPYMITFDVTSAGGPCGVVGNLACGAGTIDDNGVMVGATWSASTAAQGNGVSFTFDSAVTPEPSSLVLLGTSLLGLAFVAFRKAKSTGSAMDLSL